MQTKWDGLLAKAEQQYGLPRGLLKAQMWQESRGNPDARSKVGAMGLMQFMPETAKQYGIDPLNPIESIDGAGRYMRDLMQMFGGNVEKALAGYNWGQGNVKRKGMGVLPEETKNYIANIKANMPQAEAIDQSQIQWDETPQIEASNVVWDEPEQEQSSLDNIIDGASEFGAGALHAADKISRTLATPIVAGLDALGIGDSSRVDRLNEFRDAQYQESFGDSTPAWIAELATEIGITWPVGGSLGGLVKLASQSPKALQFAKALETGGLKLGGDAALQGGKLSNLITRVAGGATTGGVSAGLINPDDAVAGTAAGGALPAVVRGAGKVGGKVADTFLPASNGRVRRILQESVGENVDNVMRNLQRKGVTDGFMPTAGQVADNPNISALERTLRAKNPEAFKYINDQQNKALADAVRGVGGDDIQRQAFVEMRDDATKKLYDIARDKPVFATDAMNALQGRPSLNRAIQGAERIAREQGDNLNQRIATGADAQRVKFAFDDMLNTSNTTGLGANEARAIKATRDDFMNLVEAQIPEFADANRLYKDYSRPINQIDIGNIFADKFIPPMERHVDVPQRLNRAAFSRSLLDQGDKIAQDVTGFKGAKLADTLTPDQMDALTGVVEDSNLVQRGMDAGRGVGSDTFQKLSFNQVPMFGRLPYVGDLMNAARKSANESAEQKLIEALINPEMAIDYLQKSKPNKQVEQLSFGASKALPALFAD